MKYNSKIDMFRYHMFNNKWVMVIRRVRRQTTYYIDGLYMWTKAKNKWDGRIYKSNLGLKDNKEYDDWAPYTNAPSHIPDGQLWKYYFMRWKKEIGGETE